MYFKALLFTTLFLGVLANRMPMSPADEFMDRVLMVVLPMKMKAMSMDPYIIPEMTVRMMEPSTDRIVLRNGRMEDMTSMIRRRGVCHMMREEEDNAMMCHMTMDGMRITFDGMMEDGEETMEIEMIMQQSLIEVIIGKAMDGKATIKDMMPRSMFMFVRKPTYDMERMSMFHDTMQMKMMDMMNDFIKTDLMKVMKMAVEEEMFP